MKTDKNTHFSNIFIWFDTGTTVDWSCTRDVVWSEIYDYLYSDGTGLPTDCYTEDDVKVRADEVYETVLSPYYGAAAAT